MTEADRVRDSTRTNRRGVHIINHTHWDREWFTTAEYTTAWIPALVERVEQLSLTNADFAYVLDGQTLIIEDLLTLDADQEHRVRRLVESGALIVGPLYCQPDWRLLGGELLVRNIALGLSDAARLGSAPDFAWMVDTFGHVSQTPQLVRMFGIHAVFIWRGVPNLQPRFRWVGPDGSEVLAVNLVAGYRNLYGVTHAPDVAVKRLNGEVSKLEPIYGELPIPLFDGYDFEIEPEDPVRFFSESRDHIDADLDLIDSSPARYLEAIRAVGGSLPVVQQELLSGKYSTTFPGSTSTRTYLKVLHHDAEHLVHRVAEPVACLAASRGRAFEGDRFEALDRMLLRSGLHDSICGVSVDQVHERHERDARIVSSTAEHIAEEALATVLAGFEAGTYAVCLVPTPMWTSVRVGEYVAVVDAAQLGVVPVREWYRALEASEGAVGFEWSNEHYTATVRADGCIDVDGAILGALRVYGDDGDTYSSERGEYLGHCLPIDEPRVVSTSPVDAVVSFTTAFANGDRQIDVRVTVRFDRGPLVRFGYEVVSTGTSFMLSAEFETNIQDGTVYASMPFDIVERQPADRDLLGELSDELHGLIMGQRDLGEVDEFPFHDFVAKSDGRVTAAVFARGLRSYRVTGPSGLAITLRRSMEWIAKTRLQSRAGDAGPEMYVPDARCERRVVHELAYATVDGSIDSAALIAHNATFQTPPLVVSVTATAGRLTAWSAYGARAAMSALIVSEGQPTMRVYNPTGTTMIVPTADGELELGARKIATIPVDLHPPAGDDKPADVVWLNPPTLRVGPRRSQPDPKIVASMEQQAARLEKSVAAVAAALEDATEPDRHRLTHKLYVLDRERAELDLSVLLNRLKSEAGSAPSLPETPVPELATKSQRLNILRIKRRIYDYVASMLNARSPSDRRAAGGDGVDGRPPA